MGCTTFYSHRMQVFLAVPKDQHFRGVWENVQNQTQTIEEEENWAELEVLCKKVIPGWPEAMLCRAMPCHMLLSPTHLLAWLNNRINVVEPCVYPELRNCHLSLSFWKMGAFIISGHEY